MGLVHGGRLFFNEFRHLFFRSGRQQRRIANGCCSVFFSHSSCLIAPVFCILSAFMLARLGCSVFVFLGWVAFVRRQLLYLDLLSTLSSNMKATDPASSQTLCRNFVQTAGICGNCWGTFGIWGNFRVASVTRELPGALQGELRARFENCREMLVGET